MKYSAAKKLLKGELVTLLANQRHGAYKCYGGHYDDAVSFVRHHYRTKASLLLAGSVRGLWGYDFQG